MYLNPRLSYMQFFIGFLFIVTFILATFNVCSFLVSIVFMALLNVTFVIGAFQQKHYTSFVMALVMAFSFSIVALVLIIK
ncbi:DUF3894 domain-containing protein [Bacillus pseudomycoides]|uniref:DUF3894 domain-containing protein n=1 Tax=Bacillus pseudomycoides TaxID=64104 RepID=A0A1S9X3G9_9BACI|nr:MULTISPECIES: DUF3894 domain-containing protein [Bacillus]EOP50706.1 hypothetical protein IIW_02907 [Bacillus cereus VD136]EOP66855.1 hypothetical protein KOW_01634 [Bacillus cereus VDM006]EOQ03381.1 hypothetical protein KOY_01231 [Bacillus cereus VDM021]AIK39069.1 hypothetical protein DJ92_1247 [Bacillus pseudomycoides]AJI17134.1 hypothetical protein BG07_3689 [Bacillus pseudomycoides]